MVVERDACIFELHEGATSIFDTYERKKIHAYNLVIENLQRLARNGSVDWDNTIEYY